MEYEKAMRDKYPDLPSKDEFEAWLAPKVAAYIAEKAANPNKSRSFRGII